MNPNEAAERLRLAELELRRAQDEHDGSARAVVRYQAARAELVIAEAVADAVLRKDER